MPIQSRVPSHTSNNPMYPFVRTHKNIFLNQIYKLNYITLLFSFLDIFSFLFFFQNIEILYINLKKNEKLLGGAKRNQQQKSAFICTMISDWCTTCPACCLSPACAQFQRKEMCRGRSPPSFTRGLWNSRPAREWMAAQQYSQ